MPEILPTLHRPYMYVSFYFSFLITLFFQDRDAIDRSLSAGAGAPKGSKPNPGSQRKPAPGKNAIEIKAPPAAPVVPVAGVVSGGQLDIEKKIKNINKKLKQIDDLRMKQASGGQLELTQISKIASEPGLLEEVR